MLTRERALELIYETLANVNADRGGRRPVDLTETTRLFGTSAALDSLEQVGLLVDLEGRLSTELNKTVFLLDEGLALADVGSLAGYLVKLGTE